MRYPPEQKTRSREKLVRASASLAKQQGFAGSGVDALASAAGLTSGAFYRHFEGKGELLSAIVETELEATRSRFSTLEPRNEEQLLLAIDTYLSLAHVRHPESGCVLPTLASEIGRASAETKEVFERALSELLAVLSEKVGDASVAFALLNQCVGAVMIARGLATDSAKRQVLEAARKSARESIASLLSTARVSDDS
ncbi:TetR/AcrR family transcriptional regulator [Archangium violaceum]|uniref:TetR/AcrR family transcriptional regulator n=1 Tax=Archangium violaceum TaxID=83451 RepID=UPI002B2BEC70|nr:TetR/AcrR family transcriptional regulator [Archangium violaceum]